MLGFIKNREKIEKRQYINRVNEKIDVMKTVDLLTGYDRILKLDGFGYLSVSSNVKSRSIAARFYHKKNKLKVHIYYKKMNIPILKNHEKDFKLFGWVENYKIKESESIVSMSSYIEIKIKKMREIDLLMSTLYEYTGEILK